METGISAKQVTIVGVDYSEPSRVALTTAAAIVHASPRSDLHVVHVIGLPYATHWTGGIESAVFQPDAGEWFSQDLKTLKEDVAQVLRQSGAEFASDLSERIMGHIRVGRADREIVRLAHELEAQLVVVGTRQHSGLERVFLGSVAERVVRAAPCAVLVARAREQPAEALIEAPCPDCLEIRGSTAGAQHWCARHSAHHPRAHIYGSSGDSYGMGSMTFRF